MNLVILATQIYDCINSTMKYNKNKTKSINFHRQGNLLRESFYRQNIQNPSIDILMALIFAFDDVNMKIKKYGMDKERLISCVKECNKLERNINSRIHECKLILMQYAYDNVLSDDE